MEEEEEHLTSGASVRPEITVTYSADNEDQKFVGFSLLWRETQAKEPIC